jgi:alpha-beta hydrolase superfamily lysophospholipase
MIRELICCLAILPAFVAIASDAQTTPPVERFTLAGHEAFLHAPPIPAEGRPWIWYAPTLKGVSIVQRKVYFDAFMKAGIAVAGYDLGEVRGAPGSTEKFTVFYEEMVKRGWSPKPVLLGQSRGGLMMLSWAVAHPAQVTAFVGIYPVLNLTSWPLKRSKDATLADFAMSEAELTGKLATLNPIDRLGGLIGAKVPVFVVHGDSDVVVPYEENTALLKERYEKAGGSIEVKVIPGEGHKVGPSFFECPELVAFVLKVTGTAGK